LNELVELMLAERLGAGKRGDPHRWKVTESGQAFRSSFLSADFGASDE
jgi:hypothetical protein